MNSSPNGHDCMKITKYSLPQRPASLASPRIIRHRVSRKRTLWFLLLPLYFCRRVLRRIKVHFYIIIPAFEVLTTLLYGTFAILIQAEAIPVLDGTFYFFCAVTLLKVVALSAFFIFQYRIFQFCINTIKPLFTKNSSFSIQITCLNLYLPIQNNL